MYFFKQVKSSVSFFMVAQELLSNWMKSQLQLELSDGEEDVDSVLQEEPSAAPPKYEHFDGESTAK